MSYDAQSRIVRRSGGCSDRVPEITGALGAGGGSDLEYVVALARTEALPERFRRRLAARVREVIPRVVVRDPARWSTYCVTPLRAVPAPDSIGADLIAGEAPVGAASRRDCAAPDRAAAERALAAIEGE